MTIWRAILRRESERKGLSYKELVNAALRRGLVHEQADRSTPRVLTRPHAFGFKPGIDLDKLTQLADELEAEEVAARHRALP